MDLDLLLSPLMRVLLDLDLDIKSMLGELLLTLLLLPLTMLLVPMLSLPLHLVFIAG
jgi:hypothetical protein